MARSLRKVSMYFAMFVCMNVLFIGPFLQACSDTPEGGCKSSEDCKEAGKTVCDKNKEKCVQCLGDSDCASGETCDTANNVCSKGCSLDSDCKDTETCRNGACVAKCNSNDDCKSTEKCIDFRCVDASCTKDEDCTGQGETCEEGVCKVKNEGQRPGVYETCPGPQGEECQSGLKCLTYKGGTANYCWKPCDKGCDKDKEVCVTEDKFAQGHQVCMKIVSEESATYNYDQGTACSDKLISLHATGAPAFGSCWKTCESKCLGGRECLNHPNVEDEKAKFCFKQCTSDSDCPDGASCKEHSKSGNDLFYCIP
ncbi:MAG TPA: hypothetical protein DCE42_29640 [Myxococcales bacterium]|nr:hypothetical protein [Deltaproteobacteria bacterium]MBU47664.1 hypothetical protein [Deltaproteobacteria bacterium]HAA58957.1 hypothetical protein [Myxococcales bacterium]